jgi:lathosterol oxidase
MSAEQFAQGLAVFLQQTFLPEGSDPRSIPVQFLATYIMLVVGGYFFYFFFSGLSFFYFFRWKRDTYYPTTLPEDLNKQIGVEIGIAVRSIPVMSILMAPFSMLVQRGHTRVYHHVHDMPGGWLYLIFSIFAFLFLTDMMIYFIHRGLHTPWMYQRFHKPHHTYRFTTPFSSHAFHPVDGWAQGVPYYLVTLILPIHGTLLTILFIFVNFWTISIHDQVDFCGAGWINSTGHHTIHHISFFFFLLFRSYPVVFCKFSPHFPS